jgi:hypothetical protein
MLVAVLTGIFRRGPYYCTTASACMHRCCRVLRRENIASHPACRSPERSVRHTGCEIGMPEDSSIAGIEGDETLCIISGKDQTTCRAEHSGQAASTEILVLPVDLSCSVIQPAHSESAAKAASYCLARQRLNACRDGAACFRMLSRRHCVFPSERCGLNGENGYSDGKIVPYEVNDHSYRLLEDYLDCGTDDRGRLLPLALHAAYVCQQDWPKSKLPMRQSWHSPVT